MKEDDIIKVCCIFILEHNQLPQQVAWKEVGIIKVCCIFILELNQLTTAVCGFVIRILILLHMNNWQEFSGSSSGVSPNVLYPQITMIAPSRFW